MHSGLSRPLPRLIKACGWRLASNRGSSSVKVSSTQVAPTPANQGPFACSRCIASNVPSTTLTTLHKVLHKTRLGNATSRRGRSPERLLGRWAARWFCAASTAVNSADQSRVSAMTPRTGPIGKFSMAPPLQTCRMNSRTSLLPKYASISRQKPARVQRMAL
ncbi:hypothetical protein D3C86_1660400 [compost metagenome]